MTTTDGDTVAAVRERPGANDRPGAGGPPRYFALAETADGAVLAGTCGRGVVRSRDGGRTWERAAGPFSGADVNNFVREPGDVVLAAAGATGVASSSDGGATWVTATTVPAPVYCLARAGPHLLAGTATGVMQRDDGEGWSTMAGPTGAVYRLVRLRHGGIVAATEATGVWLLRDGEWTSLGLADTPVYALVELEGGDLLAATRGAGILRGGPAATWRRVATPPDDPVVHSIVAGPDGGLIAGTGQGVVASRDAEVWRPVGRALAHHRIFSVLVTFGGAMLAGSYDGVFAWRGDDWERVDTGLEVGEALAVWVDAAGIAYAGCRRSVLRSDDAGLRWRRLEGWPGAVGNAYCFGRCGGRLLVGTDDGAWDAGSGRGGERWLRAGLAGSRVFTLLEIAPGEILAGTLGEGLWRRRGSTAEWTRPAEPPPHPLVFDMRRSRATGELLAATGVLVDGVKSGGIFRSGDGDRWQAAQLAATTVYDLVEPRPGLLLGGAQRCRVLRSTDGGRSFASTRPAGREDSKMYCLATDGAGRVYLSAGSELLRSDDGGESWRVVGDGLDGVTVFGLAAVADTMLAATSSGLYRSTDAGGVWAAAELPDDD